MNNRKQRRIKVTDQPRILYIKHLGEQPYNEIKFDCGKKMIVCYSLTHWHNIFQDFIRISGGVLVNPEKMISPVGMKEVTLIDNTKFTCSRRRLKCILA
jgi:hypothetical protein